MQAPELEHGRCLFRLLSADEPISQVNGNVWMVGEDPVDTLIDKEEAQERLEVAEAFGECVAAKGVGVDEEPRGMGVGDQACGPVGMGVVRAPVDLADPGADPAGVLGDGCQALGRAHTLEVDRQIFG